MLRQKLLGALLPLALVLAIAGCDDIAGREFDPDPTHPGRTQIVPVPVPGSPYGVAVSGDVVLVTNIGGNKLYRGGLPFNGVDDSITVGTAPAHVAINRAATLAFSTDQLANSLSIIDLATNTKIKTIPLGNEAYNLIVSSDGSRVYVTVNVGTGYVVNVATQAIVDSFPIGPVANGLAFSPDGGRLYASSRDDGSVVIYNTASGAIIDTLGTGGLPQRLAVSADGNELYIANEALGLDIWNLTNGTRIISVPIDAYGLALSPDNAHLYVTDPLGGMVRVVDRATRAVIDSIPTAGEPRNVAFNRLGTEALITNESGYVTVVR
jgi:YVTN family beta-propeller protein